MLEPSETDYRKRRQKENQNTKEGSSHKILSHVFFAAFALKAPYRKGRKVLAKIAKSLSPLEWVGSQAFACFSAMSPITGSLNFWP